MAYRLIHSHLCPVCKRAYNCNGVRCAPYNGVPHPQCAPGNKLAAWVHEVTSYVKQLAHA